MHKIHISGDTSQIWWGQPGNYKRVHPFTHGCVTTARAQPASKKLPAVHPITDFLHTLPTDLQEETKFNGNIRIHKLKLIIFLNRKHKDFCILRKKKLMDDEFANSTAADTPVVPNQQELLDQYFFHLNTKVNNPLPKHCRWKKKYLKKFVGLLSGGILVFNSKINFF